MNSFFAYPSKPYPLVSVIEDAYKRMKRADSTKLPHLWKQNDIAGRFLRDPIIDKIASCDVLFADITFPNFNVAYEIGYAIGRGKRLYLLKCRDLEPAGETLKKDGFLDSLGYAEYSNTEDLVKLIENAVPDETPLFIDGLIDKSQPVFYARTALSHEFEVRTLSRIKKARLGFRNHDPNETGPLNVSTAIDSVAISTGVVIHLLNSIFKGHEQHNYKMAFVAGISHAAERVTLILQQGDDPVPLDYRDLVSRWDEESSIDNYIGDFAPQVYGSTFGEASDVRDVERKGLPSLSLGSSSAENELGNLRHYFIETSEYQRCLRGEISVLAGRKGSGKTAIFSQVRNRMRRDKQNIVLDLQPEGFQLLKFKEVLGKFLSEGSREHTITAFWEYLIYLEICHKILQKDKQSHINNHEIRELYIDLKSMYETDEFIAEGDFSERMVSLLRRIEDDFIKSGLKSNSESIIEAKKLTEILYKHDLRRLREKRKEYVQTKSCVRILFDNLDKGWPAQGISSDDVTILRCLLSAMSKIEKEFRRVEVDCKGTIFIRNDVYELLVAQSSDRGKISVVAIDWSDPDLLREMLRRRINYSFNLAENTEFDNCWSQVAVSHYNNEQSAQYLIDRSLLRPRFLIDLLQECVSHAINIGNTRIEIEDIARGESAYSSQLLKTISFELHDIYPESENILYHFIAENRWLNPDELTGVLETAELNVSSRADLLEYMLWYGIIGFVDLSSNSEIYIYDVHYDIQNLRSRIAKHSGGNNLMYCLNPAFALGLELSG